MALEDASNPIVGVSGPASFSKRTDLPSKYYGEGVETANLKSQQKLSKTRGVADNVGGRPSGAPSVEPVTGLFAPTQRAGEAVTSGIDMGEGVGSNALVMQSQFAQEKLSDTLAKMLPYDATGEIGILYQQALSRGM
jgi:hypothetical protein